MALPREVRSGLWEVGLLAHPIPPAVCLAGGQARDPSTAERGVPLQVPGLIPAPTPAEAPDGQGQGPQASREHRKVGKERRGPAEVRGGAQAGRAGAVGG